MKTYTLKLTSGTTYKLYDGTTLVTDAALTTLFGSAGAAYFVFDFDGGTPTTTTDLTITDSSDATVITNTGLTGIAEGKNFKGEWSASATAFDTFVALTGKTLDEAELGFLMGKIKEAGNEIKVINSSNNAYLYSGGFASNTPTGIYIVKNTTSSDHTLYLFFKNSSGQNAGDVRLSSGDSAVLIINRRANNDYEGIWIGSNTHTTNTKGRRAPIAFRYTPNDSGVACLNTYNGLDWDYDNAISGFTSLSAYQGKVLNDKIGGDLSTLDTTTKTSLIAAINELVGLETLTGSAAPTTATEGKVGQLYLDTTNSDTYICTAIVPGTDPYVWTEVGAGAGPVFTLQTTDPGEGAPLAANNFIGVYN